MKRLGSILMTLGLLGLLYAGCDFASEDPLDKKIQLTGRVVNKTTGEAIQSALIQVRPLALDGYTDNEGRYSFEAELDSTMDLLVVVKMNGFSDGSATVVATPGSEVRATLVQLEPIAAAEPESGPASNIILTGDPPPSIGVQGSGSPEVAEISFLVADSLGRPVTLDHAVNVHFKLGASPGGGEFIYPSVAGTTNNGRVTANLSSGTRAGVVQIVAEAEVDGRILRSTPVAVTIHGGLPDADHFSVGPEVFNFPGLLKYGLTNSISVIVGDKFANPVKPGTAVYFTSSHGVIGASVKTNDEGRGSVRLTSANPLPPDGVARLQVTTADENQAPIVRETAVIFSGVPVISISPSTAVLNQTYTMTVTDPNGNPLAAGTSINVKVEGTKVQAVGNTAVTLDDTAFIGGLTYDHVLRGAGITEFTFRAVENIPENDDGTKPPKVESIAVNVSGPNGTLEIVLTGDGAPLVRTEGATLQLRADGSAIVQAAE